MATVENRIASSTVFSVLIAVTACHLMNDTLQALLLAMYPMLRDSYALTFGQIGMITLVFQVTASLFQPLIGLYTDRHPMPYSLPLAPAFTLLGLVLLGLATSYPVILLAAGAIGIGSAIFHPESSRVARIASGGRYGMAQSLFQVGGNIGSSIGPLLAAWIILPHGQSSVLWFGAIALAAIGVLSGVGTLVQQSSPPDEHGPRHASHRPYVEFARGEPFAPHSPGTDVFEVCLYFRLQQFLHLLSHRPFPGSGEGRADLPLRLSRRLCRRDFCRGAHWRPHRAQGSDLVFHSRRPALHAGAALCQPVLDGRAHRSHRPHPRLGFFRHGGLCTGALAGARRDDLRAVFRHRLWHRGP